MDPIHLLLSNNKIMVYIDYLLFSSKEINIIDTQPHANPIIVCIDILKSFLKYIVNNNNNIISRETKTLKYAGLGHIFII